MATTSLAVVLIIVGALIDAPTCAPEAYHPPIKFERFFLAFGTIMFAYGGHGAFPTIQHDMRKPYQFNRSVWLSYSSLL
jgi:amino acid permease